jgi:lysozyme
LRIRSMPSLNLVELEKDLKLDEGRRDKPYMDTTGHLTIGYGHNLDAKGLCEAALVAQLHFDMDEAIADLDRVIPSWRTHPEPVQRALVNLTFNLGISKLVRFDMTLRLIAQRKYVQAATNLMKTLYAKQVPNRARKVAALIKSGADIA